MAFLAANAFNKGIEHLRKCPSEMQKLAHKRFEMTFRRPGYWRDKAASAREDARKVNTGVERMRLLEIANVYDSAARSAVKRYPSRRKTAD